MTERTITVVGDGRADAHPDVVVVVLGVEVSATAPAAALDGAAEALSAMRSAVLGLGVVESALQTSRVNVQPEWDHRGDRSRMTGYAARVGLNVTLDDPSLVGRLLSSAVEAGGEAARVSSIGWQLRDIAAAEAMAREAAFADARQRAEHYASLAGQTLGAVVAIDERSGDFRPHRGRIVALATAASMDMEVDRGQLDVTASVTVTWELA